MKEEHIKEMTMINKSLATLGQVVHALGTNNSHVPYRDSKLTRLLQDSLGVRARTFLIATVSPSARHSEETLSTLKFADRAREVLVKLQKNEFSATCSALASRLQREICQLKAFLQSKSRGEMSQELVQLREENFKLKSSHMTVKEVECLKQENKQLRLQLQSMNESSLFVITRDNIDKPTVIDALSVIKPGNTMKDTLVSWRHREMDLGVSTLKARIVKDKRCPVCTLRPPCQHYECANKLPAQKENKESFSWRRASTVVRSQRKPLNWRSPASVTSSLAKKRKTELKETELRLSKLAQLETYREEKLQKELRRLELQEKKEKEEMKTQQLKENK